MRGTAGRALQRICGRGGVVVAKECRRRESLSSPSGWAIACGRSNGVTSCFRARSEGAEVEDAAVSRACA